MPVLVAVLLLGLWLAAGVLAPTYKSSFAFGIGWFLIAAVLVRLVVRARPDLKLPLRATFVVTAVVVAGVTAWTTFRDDTVDEDVVTAPSRPAPPPSGGGRRERPRPPGNVLVAEGRFTGLEQDSSGTAKVIELAGGRGRKLTLTDFETGNGPDLRVYLAVGEATVGSVPDYKDLGALKGNKGNQQYDIPTDVDLRKYDNVVIWCRSFSAGFAQAPLRRT